MKKFIISTLTATLMLTSVSAFAEIEYLEPETAVIEETAVLASYAEQFNADGITYGICGDGSVAVIGYTLSVPKSLVIPASVSYDEVEYRVSQIADNAFLNCSRVEEIIISEGITRIGEMAFYGCIGASSVSIPSTVEEIGEYAFRQMSSLCDITVSSDNRAYSTNGGALIESGNTLLIYPILAAAESYHIPDGVTKVYDYAFEGTKNLKTLTMADTVRTISNYAFTNITSLESVEIGRNVSTILCGFTGCSSLTEMYVPKNVSFLSPLTFKSCSALESITVDPDNKYYCVIDDVLYNTADKSVVAYPPASQREEIVIADFAETIESSVFWHCKNIKKITLSDSVNTIGFGAFTHCDSLIEFNAGEGLKTINNAAFQSCSGLKEINLNDKLTTITNNAFYNCDSLTQITLPKGVKVLGESVFEGCDALESINVAQDNSTFYSDNGVLFSGNKLMIYPIGKQDTSYTIPDDTTKIQSGAFAYSNYLTAIEAGENSEAFSSVDGVLYSKDKTILHVYPMTRQEADYSVPEGITRIDDYAFFKNTALSSITFPSTLQSIGDRAFWYCENLSEPSLPEGLTEIGKYAFLGCDEFKKVTVPSTVESVGHQAFDYCSSMEYMTFLSKNPPVFGSNLCRGAEALAYIYVPEGTQEEYKDSFAGASRTIIAAGAMVVEGEKVPLEDVLEGLDNITPDTINTLAQSYVRLTKDEKAQVSSADIRLLEEEFTLANTALSAELQNEVASLSASGYALASGVSEGEVVLVIEEKTPAEGELLRFSAALGINDCEQQIKAPILYTINPGVSGNVQIVRLDDGGNVLETIVPETDNGVITFRTMSAGTFAVLSGELPAGEITAADNNITINTNCDAKLFIAQYENERLAEIVLVDISSGETVIDLAQYGNFDNPKLMLWTNAGGMKPLCNAVN